MLHYMNSKRERNWRHLFFSSLFFYLFFMYVGLSAEKTSKMKTEKGFFNNLATKLYVNAEIKNSKTVHRFIHVNLAKSKWTTEKKERSFLKMFSHWILCICLHERSIQRLTPIFSANFIVKIIILIAIWAIFLEKKNFYCLCSIEILEKHWRDK